MCCHHRVRHVLFIYIYIIDAHVHWCIQAYIYIHAHMYVYIYIIYIYTHTHACVWLHMCTYCTHAHLYACMYTRCTYMFIGFCPSAGCGNRQQMFEMLQRRRRGPMQVEALPENGAFLSEGFGLYPVPFLGPMRPMVIPEVASFQPGCFIRRNGGRSRCASIVAWSLHPNAWFGDPSVGQGTKGWLDVQLQLEERTKGWRWMEWGLDTWGQWTLLLDFWGLQKWQCRVEIWFKSIIL